MLKMPIAVLVSGGGTNLQALIDAEKEGRLKSGRLSLVISSKEDAFALKRAEDAGIKTLCLPLKAFAERADFEAALEKALAENQIGLVVLAGFMCILSESFTSRWEKRIINVHPSLIPAFCGEGFFGLRVHKAALEKGVKLSGATVHYVNHIPDGGEIILQKSVPVYKNDSPESLQKRVMEKAEWIILPKAAEMVSKKLLKEGMGHEG